MATPSKRRRTSQGAYVTINDATDQENVQPNLTTPKRSSYLSPTKASLSRSYPKLLNDAAEAKKNRESEPNRRQSLRDAVLGNRPTLLEEERSAQQSSDNPQLPATALRAHSNEIAERGSSASSVTPNTPSRHDRAAAAQVNNNSTPRRNRPLTSFPSPSIVPQLVNSPRRSSSRNETFEIELPPTPVQLGNGKAPDRPRGLLSSSPKSTGKRRTRIRGGDIYSSPLKPKEIAPTFSGDEEDVAESVEIASGLGLDDQDGPSSSHHNESGAIAFNQQDMSARDVQTLDDGMSLDDPEISRKEKKLAALQAQLRSLQEDLEQLQTFRTTLGRSRTIDEGALEAGFEAVLEQTNLNTPISTLQSDNNPLFQKHPLPYLSLFSPSNLTMSYETWEQAVSERQNLVYQTTFAASPPWPRYTFTLSWETSVDLQTNLVRDIRFIHGRSGQRGLNRWVKARLENSTSKQDIATMVSGADAYFEAAIKRARLWRKLIELPSSTDETVHSQPDQATRQSLSEEEAKALVPYLELSQHTFTSSSLNSKTRRSLGSAKQLMVTFEIELDWIGRPNIKTDILTTGFNYETTSATKTLFRKIEGVSGVLEACCEVRKILGMVEPTEAETQTPNGADKMRSKKGKARRMTAFE